MAGSGYVPSKMYGLSLNQATLPGGSEVGMMDIVYDFDNNGWSEVMLVQAYASAAASLKINGALKFVTFGIVDMIAAGSNDIVAGVNDVSSGTPRTGVLIVAGNYFWMTVRGLCKPLLDAAVAKGPLQTGGATSGQLVAWATDAGATFKQTNLQSLVASGAGGATLCYLS